MNIHVSNTGSLRENTDLSIMEQPLEWLQDFQDNWLAHLEKTGETNWNVYTRVSNKFTPSGRAVRLKDARLLFITTLGVYLPETQQPFDEFNPMGDYSIRSIPADVPLDQLELSNAHVDPVMIQQDPQTMLPLTHLQALVNQGKLGELAPEFISFNGYLPHAIRVVKELVPTILRAAKQAQVDAALLIPAESLCVQSAGLVARALEVNGIATTIATSNEKYITLTAPPRATISPQPSNSVLGDPGNHALQRRTLEQTLSLLEMEAPQKLVHL